MKHKHNIVLSAVLLATMAITEAPAEDGAADNGALDRPNVILFFIDDMGYGDIGPYGSKVNRTPNLDRMEAEGLKFTDFYLASTACSPSRAALMTGCYAKRVGMDGRVCFPTEPKALQPSEYTMAEMFSDAGYATGCFGKWHLGHRPGYLPNDQGFDVYQGIPYSNDMWAPYDPKNKKWRIKGWHVPLPWLVDGKPVAIVKDMNDQARLTQATTQAALDFIREHGTEKKPFFAYLPYAAVHLPRQGHPDFLPENTPGATGNKRGAGSKIHLKAQIEELDWAVGEVFKTLEDLGIEKNTIVLFMSDNGGSGGTSMGPLRGGKGSQYEGGIRTPLLAWWPQTIPAGAVCREIGITSDFLPTFAKLCGGKLSDNKIDGKDISDMFLRPDTAKSPHEYVMHTGRNAACREGKWKMVGNELYDLDKDIGEKNDIADQHPEKLGELKEQFQRWNETMNREQRPHAQMPDPGPLVSEVEANAMPALSAWLKQPKSASSDSHAPADPRPILAVHDTTDDPFLMSNSGVPFGDPFPVHWDRVWHLYSLSANLKKVYHFTSTDLVRWTEHQPAMIGKGIATGSVVRHGGKYYLFYTDARQQRICLVTSDNPWQFDFDSSRQVAVADGKVYKPGWFRDPHVFYNEDEKQWWMLPEARCPEVAVGLFTSNDLETWERRDPIFKDAARRYGSCPQIFQHGGHWYLTLLDYPTWYYMADDPRGPWHLEGFYHTKRLTAASRWADSGKRRLGWGFFTKHPTPERRNQGYGGPLGVGREMVFLPGGKIGVRPLPELIAAIRKAPGHVDLFRCAKSLSGKWVVDASQQRFRCAAEDGGTLLLNLPKQNPNYYFEAEIELDRSQADATLVVRSSKDFDEGYRVVMKPSEKEIAIRQFAPKGGAFDKQDHAFPGGATVSVKVFVCNGQIEVFFDGRSSLSARVQNRSHSRLAIEIADGGATIRKPLLHYFNYAEDE